MPEHFERRGPTGRVVGSYRPSPSEPSAAKKREWAAGRDHGGGWHYIYDGSGIVRADVFGWQDALLVTKALADDRGHAVREQTEDDLCDPMFTKAVRDAIA